MKLGSCRAVYFRHPDSGAEPARLWIDGLKDKLGKAKILIRIQRAEAGQFGQHAYVGGGVWEMKVNFGPGYRLYYSLIENELLLLLIGGDKSTQKKDIERAKVFLSLYKDLEHADG